MTGPLTDQPPTASSRAPAVVALLAGVVGVVLLVLGVLRFTGSGDGIAVSTTTVGFVTTTTTQVPASDAPATTGPATTDAPAATSPVLDLVTVTDDSGTLSVSIPSQWDDVTGLAWSVDGEVVGISIGAAPDRDAWYEGWGTPGAFVGVTTVGPDVYTPELGDFGGACTPGEVDDREYERFTAIVQQWVDCGDAGSEFHVALVWPDSFAYTALIQLVTLDGSGSALVDVMVNTLSHSR